MRPLARLSSFSLAALIVAGCDETAPRGPGSIRVVAMVQGHQDEPVFFPYGISIDNGTPREAFTFDTVVFQENGLAHGTHVVQVVEVNGFDIPAACGAMPREEVQLQGDDTVDVVIDVECARTTGDLMVSAVTTGSDVDTDGYIVLVDQQARGAVGPNGSTMIRFISPGSHSIGLTGVASNCSAPGAQNFQVTAGSQGQAVFQLTCSPVAVLRFVATITGADRDPDGTVLRVDNGPPQQLGVTGTTYVRVAAGTRSISISDVQPNCTLGGSAAGSHTLAQGDTVTVNVNLTCTPISLGNVGVSGTDPVADTLSNPLNTPTAALDVLGVTGRYSPGFMIVVVRFNRAVAPANDAAPGSVYGFMQFDVDENVATGIPPASNTYGGSASMGADYLLDLFATDTASTVLVQTSPQTGIFGEIGSVRVRFEADSMMVFVPLNKFNDDGNMAMTFVIGTSDRPTDVVPNTGTFLLRPPASIVAGAAIRALPQPIVRRTIRIEDLGKWRKRTP